MQVATTKAPSVEDESLSYVIRESRELPQIDCALALKNVLLRGKRLQQCNRFLSRHKRWLAMALLWGIAHMFAAPFLPAKFGRFCAPFGLVEFPALIAALISLRYDMILLILHTYEFWYLTGMNVVYTISVALNYQDTRALILAPGILSFELLFLQDANFRALNFTIKIFGITGVVLLVLMVYTSAGLIDQWHDVEVVRYGNHAIMADNIITTYLVNISSVLLRNAYRKHRWVRDCSDSDTTIVRCITYRCRVHLCPLSTLRVVDNQRSLLEQSAQMRLVPSKQIYDSNLTVLSHILPASRARAAFTARYPLLILLYSAGLIGLVLTCEVLLHQPNMAPPTAGQQPVSLSQDTLVPIGLSVASTVLSGVFCGVFLSMYQRQLLLKLLTSFDFSILAMNITLLHLCVADIFKWTPKCFGLASSWMWILWAVSTDALTPNMRQALALRKQYMLLVIVVFVALVVMLAVEVVFLQQWDLQDRDLFQVWTSRIKVVQVLFSCLVSLLPMCSRIAWRLYNARTDELIMIHGAVEYDDALLAQRRKRHNSGGQAQRSGSAKLSQVLRSSIRLSWLSRLSSVQPGDFSGNPMQMQANKH